MTLYRISDIEKICPTWYDSSCSLSRDDQQFIWENTPLQEPIQTTYNTENVNVLNESVNEGSKLPVSTELALSKSEVILRLSKCTYKTAPKLLAYYLEILFSKWPSKEGHWLWIAQRYNPRAINRQINETIKQEGRGCIKTTPAQYFTYRIKYRRRRRGL